MKFKITMEENHRTVWWRYIWNRDGYMWWYESYVGDVPEWFSQIMPWLRSTLKGKE